MEVGADIIISGHQTIGQIRHSSENLQGFAQTVTMSRQYSGLHRQIPKAQDYCICVAGASAERQFPGPPGSEHKRLGTAEIMEYRNTSIE